MIWYGNRVALTDRASQNMRTLVGALFVFMCLCGMLCILVWAFAVKTGYQYRGVSWLGQWPAFVFLAWLCMGIFCALFVSVIWRRLNMRTKNGAFDYSRRDEDVVPDA
mmetsp:Transcript_19545/g.28259  ORF Transcript_19545/g.28259 Transcript_19545/m.28259 type:complete len:108 (-) Transcript_19545:60-383(-)